MGDEGNFAFSWYFRKSFFQVVFSTSVYCFRFGNFGLTPGRPAQQNSSKMHSWSVIMGIFLANRDAPSRCPATDCLVVCRLCHVDLRT